MLHAGNLQFDTATLINQGRRERQEDAVIADFPSGSPVGLMVLADGMGGHDAGDVASKIVVTEVFSELKLQSGNPGDLEDRIGDVLHGAMHGANECVGLYSQTKVDDFVMGATLLATVLIENRLFWVSVGDSPLFLLRRNELRRLNDEHAVGSQIDYLVETGQMRRDEALTYPDQNCLTSVIVGGEIPQVDCPAAPLQLIEGDILIAASDGVLVLSDERIAEIARAERRHSAQRIADALMSEIIEADDPSQDNVSFGIVKVSRRNKAIPPQDEDPAQCRTLSSRQGNVTIVATISGTASAAG
ncbi:SpoIIE family protein phosphatase [Alisedimentitalea sp. MJ-SS2]|uniref:PP2C family protein-serine/threonine phosphatase n=1 Tax=Aliisedimentitalea sp. MJ-SS2 TaxID=3049795 RepID=UPI002910BB27|nr:protein phosphatase 2C domain-containing protein [Alisedimentitalea sp. MJ-SS2]MDU8927839.1 SpoIIE family protein phosphatase [Alisedimentitalea sp. MJ-SS2]